MTSPDPGLSCDPFPLVLAGPSGAGKTTLARALAADRDDVRFSVSATTRAPRAGEVDGVDYRFLSRTEFERLRDEGELLEWASVHGELYGTPRDNLREASGAGAHLLLDIDVQGARSIRRAVPHAATAFILPPSGRRIVDRLRARGTEGDEALRERLRAAGDELEAIAEFDYVLVNDDLAASVRALEAVLEAEKRRVARLGERAMERARALAGEIRRAVP